VTQVSTIFFKCRHCGQPIEVEGTAVGMKCQCPACEGEITIPLRSEIQKQVETSPMEHFYQVLEDFHQELSEFEGSGLDLNSSLLSGAKARMHETLNDLIKSSKEVCRQVDAQGFRVDMSVDWPPRVSVSFDFSNPDAT